MKLTRRQIAAIVSGALALVLLGTGIGLNVNTASAAETAATATVVVTSPFTQAIADVKDSVVGVNNYQTVRYSNYGGNYGNWGYGWGYGWDNGWGNGNGNTTQEVLAASGSGVVIAKGYVLTNHHVVEDAASLKIAVMEEGAAKTTEFDAVLVAKDENLDIAIVYCPKLTREPVTLGDSDKLQVGDWAICIGNPLSDTFYGTVTTGIVSALDRSVSSRTTDRYGRVSTTTNTMIQTDAAINSGNSGGGMFSVTGELMGIPTMKYSGSYSRTAIDGIGLCIPINAAKPLIDDVLSGTIRTPEAASTEENAPAESAGANSLIGRPRLGVTVASVNANSTWVRTGALPNGVYVSEVEANSPAETAGVQAGDIIVEMDGTVITNVTQLQSIVGSHGEGDTIPVKVYRVENMTEYANGSSSAQLPDGQYIDLEVTLAIIDGVKQ